MALLFLCHLLKVITYALFSSGVGTTYWHVLLGRVVSGIGGAGMVGLVAVIIAGTIRSTLNMRL